ncbi:hypothetical protein FRB94_007704 [Tulasnella sp. JGI-2019a]|nr:hypothetical protein FRB93_007731 [Tulasnella sp. JGI-2019a]KAG8997349.1 hypothetical protein FRB94_007704 [Tulasnella sp. JGI-2019a]
MPFPLTKTTPTSNIGSSAGQLTQTIYETGPRYSSSGNPPPYFPPSGEQTPLASSFPESCKTPRIHHIYRKEVKQSIMGLWSVDPNMPAFTQSDDALPPEPNEGDNVHLESYHGSILANLNLVSDDERPTVSVIRASSHYGVVTIKIRERLNQRFHLNATSHDGDVSIHLPTDFDGPITWSNGTEGTTIFSPEIQRHLAYHSLESNGGKAFLTRRGVSTDAEESRGDAAMLGSQNGQIRISYVHEAF